MQLVQELVSVTIPFHNISRFLSETIESVLAQEYADWEMFLVDDGSTDGSARIAQEYAAAHPGRIFYLEHPGHSNLGVTRTRNLGAKMSRGEYLAFLDSDDLWLPHKLTDQVALMRAHPGVGLIYAPSEYWLDWDRESTQKNYVPELAPPGRVYTAPELFLRTHPIGKGGAPCPSSWLIRRKAFDKVGGFVEDFNPQTRQLCEDTAFLTRIYLSDIQVMASDVCSDRYRLHAASIWSRMRGTTQEELELKFYFRWLRRFLHEINCRDPRVLSAVRRAAWMYWLPLPGTVIHFMRRVEGKWRRWRR